MQKETKYQTRKKWVLIISTPFVIIVLILLYYQLLYKSPRVNSGMVQPGILFKAHTAQLRGVRFDPNGMFVVSGSVDSTVRIWTKETGKVIRILEHPAGVSSIDISKDGNYVVTGSYDATVRLWRVADGALLKELKGHKGTVWTVAFSADAKFIASSGDDATGILWDAESGKRLNTLSGHKRTVWSIKFSPDGNTIATASYDLSIKLWNVADGKIQHSMNAHTEAIVDLAFSNNGKMFASTSDDKTIKVWNTSDRKLIQTLKVAEHIQAVVFSPDDARLLTAGRDKPMPGELLQEIFGNSKFNKGVSMRLWDVKTGKLLQTFTDHVNDVNDVAYSNDGLWIASASDDRTVRLYRVVR